MTPAEVITADANERGIDPQQVLGAVAQLIQNNQGKLFNAGNSVLFVRLLSEDIGELHFFTEDSPIAIARYIKVFWSALKKIIFYHQGLFVLNMLHYTKLLVYIYYQPCNHLALRSNVGPHIAPCYCPKMKHIE